MGRGAWIGCLFAVAVGVAQSAEARTVTDSAGRVVEIPETIERVYASGPPAGIVTFAVAPQKLLGWSRKLRRAERPYVGEIGRDLPGVGRLTGRGGDANLERVLSLKPDLIIDFGSIRDTFVSLANRVQAQTGIPYLLIDGRFDATPESLRLLGDVLGEKEHAEDLAQYAEEVLRRIDAAAATVSKDDRPRAYLARGPNGLETGAFGSINTEIIERAGARNVVFDFDLRRNIVQVSMEDVLAWNPDTIFTWDDDFLRRVRTDPAWRAVEAVQRERVYYGPILPFGWIDRPPSVNRLLGLRWMGALFHPQAFPEDFREEVRRFYRLFNHVDLTDAQIDALFQPPE